MRVVAALGGNAVVRRENARAACRALAPIAREHELVIAHGNGPDVGMLALQDNAYAAVEAYPLDVLAAQTEGMVGYLVAQELANALPSDVRLATLLTMVEIDPTDAEQARPAIAVGPAYTAQEAQRLRDEKGWDVELDGHSYRRFVVARLPRRVLGVEAVDALLESGCVVVCAGGGVPVAYAEDEAEPRLTGVEAVVDKDFASALLALDLHADALVILTDVDAVYADWGTPRQRAISRATPTALAASPFAEASMGPKVRAACSFVSESGGLAAIGSVDDAEAVLRREKGTIVTLDARGLELVNIV